MEVRSGIGSFSLVHRNTTQDVITPTEANCQVPVCIRKVLSQMFIFITIISEQTMQCKMDMGALHSLVIPYQLGWREPHNILYNWITWKWFSDHRSGFFDTRATHEQDQPGSSSWNRRPVARTGSRPSYGIITSPMAWFPTSMFIFIILRYVYLPPHIRFIFIILYHVHICHFTPCL